VCLQSLGATWQTQNAEHWRCPSALRPARSLGTVTTAFVLHLSDVGAMQVDAGVADQLVLGDPKAPRFVLWNGELLPTPSGPDVLTFRLLSLWGKIRAGLGAVGIKQPLPGAAQRSLAVFHLHY